MQPADDARPLSPEQQSEWDQLLDQAYEDYMHGSYATALEKAHRAHKIGATSTGWRLIGASSC